LQRTVSTLHSSGFVRLDRQVLRKTRFVSGAEQHVSKYNNLNFGMPRLVGGEHQFEAFYFAIEL